jgi:hypothetical protein
MRPRPTPLFLLVQLIHEVSMLMALFCSNPPEAISTVAADLSLVVPRSRFMSALERTAEAS